jgi:hypothetical protein
LVMSLTTPDKIRNLQRKLYCKAKAEPAFRFYLLYDKICREDILVHAYRLARVNAGAPGVDGMTFARIEEQGLEAWLAGLRGELVSKTYRSDPVRRVMIRKANGGERPLGIPPTTLATGRGARHTVVSTNTSLNACAGSLARRHKVQGRGNRRFTFDVIHRELGVLGLQRLHRTAPSCASR